MESLTLTIVAGEQIAAARVASSHRHSLEAVEDSVVLLTVVTAAAKS
jgi:hypothetical protein